MNVLDVGCGKGENCFFLLQKSPNGKIYGVDLSKENIAWAKSKYGSKIKFKSSKAENLPFDNSFFDIVYCYEVLEHVADLKKSLNEIKRVLKKNGKFIFSVPLEGSEKILLEKNPLYWSQIGHRRFFSKNKIMKILRENNFELINYKTYNSIEHLYWIYLFRKNYKILNQNSKLNKKEPIIPKGIKKLLNQDNFKVYYKSGKITSKLIYLSKAVLYPLSLFLDKIFINKKQFISARLK
jgi:SAM-dependent methyltransferase